MDEIFCDSYERCMQRADFFDLFYDRFIASSELIAQKFADTDMATQKRMLDASLHTLMSLRYKEAGELSDYFKRIGTAHGRNVYDVGPELYDFWLTSLLETVEACDSRYDARVGQAWRQLLSGGIEIMQSMY